MNHFVLLLGRKKQPTWPIMPQPMIATLMVEEQLFEWDSIFLVDENQCNEM